MRFGPLVVAAVLVGTVGCSTKQGALVRVNVSASSMLTASSLTLDVTAGGKTKSFPAAVKAGTIPPALSFLIELPPSAFGTVTVTATAAGSSASGSTTVAAGEEKMIDLTLGQAPDDLAGADVPPPDLFGLDLTGADLVPPPDLATAPMLSLNKTSINFGPVANGGMASATVTLSNSGNGASATLTVSSTDTTHFALSNDTCSTTMLAPQSSCTFDIVFHPDAIMPFGGSVLVAGLAVNLLGSGVMPSELSASPNVGHFPDIVQGDTNPKITFTVTNDGGANSGVLGPATIGGTDVTQFMVSADNCKKDLASAGTCTFEVTFTPSSPGSYSAFVSITLPSGAVLTVQLDGRSRRPATLRLSDTTFHFGGVTVSTQVGHKFTAFNDGDVAIDAAKVDIAESVAGGPFLIANNTCTSGILAGGSCTFDVTFKPTAQPTASDTITVTIITGAAGSPQTLFVDGSGTAPACTDADGDGHFVEGGICGPLDACDNNPNAWTAGKCGTCVDSDGDGFFAGCNGANCACDTYATVQPDCNDGDAKSVGGGDNLPNQDGDCDGNTWTTPITPAMGICVSLGGDDVTGDGTPTKPLRTIAKALSMLGTKRNIFLANGTYNEQINLNVSTPYRVTIVGSFQANYANQGAVGGTTIDVSASAATAVLLTGPPPSGKSPKLVVALSTIALNGASYGLVATSASLFGTSVNVWGGPSGMVGMTVDMGSVVDFSGGSIAGGAGMSPIGLQVKGMGSSFTSNGTSVYGADAATRHMGGMAISADSGARVSFANAQIFGGRVSGSSTGVYVGNNANVTIGGGIFGTSNGTTIDGGDSLGSCNAIYQNGGDLAVYDAVVQCTLVLANGSIVTQASGANSLLLVNSVIQSPASNMVPIALDGAAVGNRIVNNYISSAQTGISVGSAGAMGTQIVNNIISFAGSSPQAGVKMISGTGKVDLLNNAVSGGSCLGFDASCASSQNSFNQSTWSSRINSTSGNFVPSAACLDSSWHLISTQCKNKGIDPFAAPTLLPDVFVDIDGTQRPVSTWDVGPDEQ